MSVQHIWNFFQLLGLFTGRKLANLSWDFVTERYKQHPETTTSRDVKGLAIGSFLEHIVFERANDDLCSGLLIFRGKKSKISRDFQGQIRGKIGRFRGIFAGKK